MKVIVNENLPKYGKHCAGKAQKFLNSLDAWGGYETDVPKYIKVEKVSKQKLGDKYYDITFHLVIMESNNSLSNNQLSCHWDSLYDQLDDFCW